MYYVVYNWFYVDYYIVDDWEILLDNLFEDETIVYGPASYGNCELYLLGLED